MPGFKSILFAVLTYRSKAYLCISENGLVVQWIVYEFPKLRIQVRFLARPLKSSDIIDFGAFYFFARKAGATSLQIQESHHLIPVCSADGNLDAANIEGFSADGCNVAGIDEIAFMHTQKPGGG